jgi:tetratricopeptide (TPR) repeat protein
MSLAFRFLLASLMLAMPLQGQTLSIDVETLGLPESDAMRLRTAIDDQSWPVAEAILFSFARTGSPAAPLLRALGAAHLQCGRYLQAARAYREADSLEPLDAGSRFALASAYLGLERRHWARRELERLAAEEPENPLYPNALAGIFHQYQWFELAEEQAHRAIDLAPDSAEGHDQLGQALEGRNRIEEALAAYRAALRKDRVVKKRSPWPAYHLGRLLLESARVEEAAPALEEALSIDPAHVDAMYEWAMALRKLDQPEQALAAFQKAALLAPDQARIEYALSQTYRRLGRIAEAQDAASRFRALSRE